MKKLALFVTALMVAACGYAGSAHLSKGALSGAWKAKHTTGLAPANDINIVYGGVDMSPRHALVSSTATA